VANTSTGDSRRIRIGAGIRSLPRTGNAADSGRVRVGAGIRALPLA
jgi:hypothetical protein